MTNDRMLLILNPHSGVNSKKGMAEQLAAGLAEAGFRVHTAFTQGPGHATELALQAVAEGYGSVAVCGGDGTVNETAQGLCGTETVLGIIPSGSGNGLARHLGLPIDEEWSLDVIARRNVMHCDCGLANGHLFFCTMGMGFDGIISHRFAANEGRRGRTTYIKNVLEEFARYKPQRYRITIDGETREMDAFLVAVCNASQYGNNAFIAPEASVTDGLLDVVVIKSGNIAQMFQVGVDLISAMSKFNSHYVTFRARQVVVECRGEAWAHIDGEAADFGKKVEVRCLPGQLRIYAPEQEKGVKPIITPIDMTLRDWRIALTNLFNIKPLL